MTSVSVIIPTIHANPHLLDACVKSVESTAPWAEILVVDRGLSFAEHCNLGASQASGSILVFLNDDCDPATPDWLELLTRPLISEPDIGITGARLTYPNGSLQHAGIYFNAPGGILTANNVLEDLPSRDVDGVTGACLAIRSTLFRECDGFDEAFVNGYEDVDLCLRVRAGGWRVHYVAEAHLIHHESASGPARWTHVAHNIQRLQDLWTISSSSKETSPTQS